jgi:hypothetical protein
MIKLTKALTSLKHDKLQMTDDKLEMVPRVLGIFRDEVVASELTGLSAATQNKCQVIEGRWGESLARRQPAGLSRARWLSTGPAQARCGR